MTCIGSIDACGSETLTDKLEQLACLQGTGQRADDSALRHRKDIIQFEQSCQTMVDASLGLVEVGVGAVNADAVTDGGHEDAADIVLLGIDDLQTMEKQRMMAHHKLAATTVCLVDDFLGDVETRKDSTDLHAGVTALEASVVVGFLQLSWRNSLDSASDIVEIHLFTTYKKDRS